MRKAIILVAFMVIGISGGWEETNYLNYQFQKVIDTQAGENLQWFSGVQSSANFNEYGPYGYSGANVNNYAAGVYADQIFYEGQSMDTNDVLTQYGSATLKSQSPDLQTPEEVMSFSSATAGQNMALSGLFDHVAFWGENYASVSEGYDSAHTYYEKNDPARLRYITIWGKGNSRFTEANMGTETTVGLEQLMAPGAILTLSGDYNAWGSFDGAYNPIVQTFPFPFLGLDPDITVYLGSPRRPGFQMYNRN